MAEDSDAEKTEPASAKRIEQAREEGDVPRSREVATFTVLMASGCCLWFAGEGVVRRLTAVLVAGLNLDREHIFNPDALFTRIFNDAVGVMLSCLPLGVAVMAVALASPLLVGGWLFSGKAFMPKFGKLNPIKGIGNMISVNALVELLKAVAKTIVVGVVAWMVMQHQKDAVLALAVEPLRAGSAHLVSLLITAFMLIVGALGLIAAIDGPYQVWHYAHKMRMTRQEVTQENKESDGNPQIKAKIRQMQHEMSRRRMMAAVPGADVVVTNPTHYAVALKYGDDSRGAPQVVAKGSDEVAARIRELARENHVAILEAPALARALHKHTDIGDEIPEALYAAVAEVLAYVFQLRAFDKGAGARPERPGRLPVPPELDPLSPASQPSPDTPNGATP
ncbi:MULTISPECIES: flagellar biosynthesis protein FlhB [unclassified Janthinobacterium]|uniref:flagellar biosynthesis protein FlhB n=1 Tax=unclassified Janthinobacterium TaxID=2610881 RepID=UPI00034B990C|nr:MULTISPECIES: flagellar biosynthesis protein FlhB [unclassified Janthinobacterium]MEC5162243.1 flagellar biosynthetic protein FlhB [Janthinobacterium sp. CG_S6]